LESERDILLSEILSITENVEHDRVDPLTNQFYNILSNILGFTVVINPDDEKAKEIKLVEKRTASRYIYVFDPKKYTKEEAQKIINILRDISDEYTNGYGKFEKSDTIGKINFNNQEQYTKGNIIEKDNIKILVDTYNNNPDRVFSLYDNEYISILRISGHSTNQHSEKQTDHEGKHSKYGKSFKVRDAERHCVDGVTLEKIKSEIKNFFLDISKDMSYNITDLDKAIENMSDNLVNRKSVEYKRSLKRKG
jgi:hypothetical protein